MLSLITLTTAEEAADYAPLLAELGMSREQSDAHTRSLQSIHELANTAQTALLDLSQKRVDHDRAMRKTLSPENYAKYMDYEKMKPVKLEIEAINALLVQRQIPPGDYADIIARAVLDSGAFTTEATHGPYDPAPRPTASGAEHLPVLRSRIERIQQTGTAALETLSSELPPEVTQIVSDYYNQRLTDLVRSAEAISSHLSMTPGGENGLN